VPEARISPDKTADGAKRKQSLLTATCWSILDLEVVAEASEAGPATVGPQDRMSDRTRKGCADV